MTGNLQAAPLAADDAVPVEHEGAALDAAHLLAVHVLDLDDPEQSANLLVLVREQLERETHFLLEVLVRLEAVAGDADDVAAGTLEIGVQVPEIRPLGGAAGGIVLGVEIDDEEPRLGRGQAKLLSARARQRKISYQLILHRYACPRAFLADSGQEINPRTFMGSWAYTKNLRLCRRTCP